jgi:hypothetical protein
MNGNDSITIPCARCGKDRDFSHIQETVEDWQDLIPILQKSWCQTCRLKDILDNLHVCLCTRHEVMP